MAAERLKRLYSKLENTLPQDFMLAGITADVGYALDDIRALQPPREEKG